MTDEPDALRRMRETQDAIRQITEGPEYLRRLRETQDAIRQITEGPEYLRRLRETQDAIRQITEGPEYLRRLRETQDAIRQITEGPEYLRRLRETQDAIRQITEGPEFLRQMREQQELIARITRQPEFDQLLGQSLDGLRNPAGLAALDVELESFETAANAIVESSAERQPAADVAIAQLRTALEDWNADAVEASALAVEADSDVAFGWIDALPTVAQLKLLLSTLDVLNALLIFVGLLSHGLVPQGVVAAAEVLIRLERALLERLGDRPKNA